jgi:uncharacterized protein YbbC (DUF1343 family)
MFRIGLENLKNNLPEGKIGLISNISSVTGSLELNLDHMSRNGYSVKRIFSPEHGIYGTEANGAEISDSEFRGVPVTSLYGHKMKPDKSDMEDLDFLVYDIQDAGVRFYTFISTLYNLVEVAGEISVPLYVLDRPNPLNAEYIGGPVLKEQFRSFVGTDTLPSRYGLTIGELALFFNRKFHSEVSVVKMTGYSRKYYFDDVYEWFIPPSLNLPDLDAVITYSGLCLLEATDLSLGRGTPYPFHFFGKPGFPDLTFNHEGVKLRRTRYRPNIDPFRDQPVDGYFLHIMDRSKYDPFRLAISLLLELFQRETVKIVRSKLARLYGSDELYRHLESGATTKQIMESWETEQEEFGKLSREFHIY